MTVLPDAPAPGGSAVGLDLCSPTLRAADVVAAQVVEVLRSLGALGAWVVATHLTRRGALPHVCLSVQAPGAAAGPLALALAEALPTAEVWPGSSLPAAQSPAAEAAAAQAARRSGRAVHFPGVEQLVGTLPVADVLTLSAVDGLRVLGGSEVDPGALLVTRDHVRPSYEAGRLVLVVERAARGALVPFEVPDPTPCCADHA